MNRDLASEPNSASGSADPPSADASSAQTPADARPPDCLKPPDQIRGMFARIVTHYDRLNALLSLGLDRLLWRPHLVRSVLAPRPRIVLDVATGTGDVWLALRAAAPPDTRVLGSDFCAPMLVQAQAKARQAGFTQAPFVVADALSLPFPDQSVDAITVAFGLRNFPVRRTFYDQALRILRPGGRVWILEFTQPPRWILPGFQLYCGWIVPQIVRLHGADPEAYRYLSRSIAQFPAGPDLARDLAEAGFQSPSFTRLFPGPVALHTASR